MTAMSRRKALLAGSICSTVVGTGAAAPPGRAAVPTGPTVDIDTALFVLFAGLAPEELTDYQVRDLGFDARPDASNLKRRCARVATDLLVRISNQLPFEVR